MKSPFPGMDPYLERRWSDVHVKLIGFIGEQLSPRLPDSLRARAEERLLLEEVGGESLQQYRPDVAVIETSRLATEQPAIATSVTVPEPYVIQFQDGPQIDRFIRIIDVENENRLVTAIEVLSPWNKAPGRLNADYHKKLDDYTRAGVSVVEVDLLRTPRGRLKVSDQDLPPEARRPYMVCVQRGWLPGRWEAYPIGLRSPIPAVRIPLRRTDADVILELQPLIERVYLAGRHDDINYSKPPVPPLEPDDAAWADELLRVSGRRH